MSNSMTMNSSEDSNEAIRLKALGNEDFKNGRFDKAIEHYSKAIGSFNFSNYIFNLSRKRKCGQTDSSHMSYKSCSMSH